MIFPLFLSAPNNLHQLRHASALGHAFDGKAVRLHNGAVILLMGFPRLRRHGDFVVEVGKTAVRVERVGVEDGLLLHAAVR